MNFVFNAFPAPAPPNLLFIQPKYQNLFTYLRKADIKFHTKENKLIYISGGRSVGIVRSRTKATELVIPIIRFPASLRNLMEKFRFI
jgi:hypothetical protein